YVTSHISQTIISRLNHHPPRSGTPQNGAHSSTTPYKALTGPNNVVMAYFNALNTKQWRWAWKLEGHNISKSTGTTYKEWRKGYRTTHNNNVTITSTNGTTVSVLLVALQINGQAQICHNVYTVQEGAIIIAHDQQVHPNLYATWNGSFSSLYGDWAGPDGSNLRIYEDGIGVSHFRTSQNCRTHPSPPCNSGPSSQMLGGVIVYQLSSQTGNKAYGTVVDSSTAHSSRPVTIKFHRSTDSIVMITGPGHSTTYCGPHGSAESCKA